MKKLKYTFLLFILTISTVSAQVGINTDNPKSSSLLDIESNNKGVLIPRVQLNSIDDPSPLSGTIPEGTMVFNIATNGTGSKRVFPDLYIWYNNKWTAPAAIQPTYFAAQYQNPSTSTTNFNPSSAGIANQVTIDIFGTEVFNDDSDIFERVSDYQLKLKKSGLYLISLNMALKQSPPIEDSRVHDYIQFYLDNTLASSSISTLVPQYRPDRVSSEGRFAFGLYTYILVQNDNQLLTLTSKRMKDGSNYNGNVYFEGPNNLSSVTILKIK